MPANQKRSLLVSKVWIQAAIIVFLIGFLILGLLAYSTYTGEPPIPGRVVDPNRNVLFTHDEILAGQGTFLRNGLMEYGSIFGHGAYLEPDYTADYLHRAVLIVRDSYGGPDSDKAQGQAAADFKTNRYSEQTDTLVFTPRSAKRSNSYKRTTAAISVTRPRATDCVPAPSPIHSRSRI